MRATAHLESGRTPRRCLALCALLLAGCAGGRPDPAAPRRARNLLPRPLALRLALQRQRGPVAVSDDPARQRFRPLAEGAGVRGATSVRVAGAAALVIGDGQGEEAARVYLRRAALLHVGQTEGGTLRLALRAGAARLVIHGARAAQLVVRRKLVDVGGQDLLLHAGASGVTAAATARHLGAAAWTLALDEPARPAGVGTLAARRRDGKVVGELALTRLTLDARRHGDVVEAHVEHVFHNPTGERLEGTFRFPLPRGAALTGLAMEIDGKLMAGELVERRKARRTYEKIVDEMRDPALLEWERGNAFKLRVFPIEPRSDKRLLLRLVVPLERTLDGPVFRYATAAPAGQQRIGRFRALFDGKQLVDRRDFTPGEAIVVPVKDEVVPRALREKRADGSYTALRVRPDWRQLRRAAPAGGAAGGRDLLLLVDTSRSALESRQLALTAAELLLADLRPARDRLLVAAADLTVRGASEGFVAATAAARRAALGFLRRVEHDGATDLGAALVFAGAQARASRASRGARQLQVVYVGDGTPTWGETEPAALRRLAAAQLARTPFHALVLGRKADGALLAAIAGRSGGQTMLPRTRLGVRRFALRLAGAATAPRLRQVTFVAGAADEVYPRGPLTLFEGDETTVLVRTPPGKAPPRQVRLKGVGPAGAPVELSFPATAVAAARHVARRWARQRIVELQQRGASRDKIVSASLRYQVLSRHTAFLVLESEAAYRRHGIVRRQRAGQRQVRVTGQDLESTAAPRARLSPEQLQPGDPEVRIPAPADARSVVVVFPFGETKVARYEARLRAWTVRFLVDQATADGVYHVVVRITHRDGRVEIQRLPYVVDTAPPRLQLSVVQKGSAFVIRARQRVGAVELRKRAAGKAPRLVRDAKRVEVGLPDGRVLRLRRVRPGRFVGRWRPRRPPGESFTLRVVASDFAYNRGVTTLRYAEGAISALPAAKGR